MRWQDRQCENLDKACFDGVGMYGIPQLAPVEIDDPGEMIDFTAAMRFKRPNEVGVHFFLRDFQFTRVWASPTAYVEMLARFRFVCTPDFSLFTDYPMALQIYNHYRKHWLGAYWQSLGITVVPTICWADRRSFDFCFDGEPKHSTVAVSSVGTQIDTYARQLFLQGFERMISVLEPTTVLFYGNVPDEVGTILQNDKNEIRLMRMLAFQRRLRTIGSEK